MKKLYILLAVCIKRTFFYTFGYTALLFLWATSACAFDGLVTNVHDGDTITVNNELGAPEKIRLLRADTPELNGKKWGYQPYAGEAKTATLNLCMGKVAKIERHGIDRYGRTLGYIRCGGVDLATYLIQNGDAWVYRYSSTKALRLMQITAKEKGLGLWALPNPVEPILWRKNGMH